MIFSILSGALNAFSKSQIALLNRALGFGDVFDTVVSESLGALGVMIQPPEVPKAYYGLDDGTMVSFFKSRLRYLYLTFFLTLGLLCIFHYMFRCRNKWTANKNNSSPKSLISETNEKGVQTLQYCSDFSELMSKQIIQDGKIYRAKKRLSRTRMTRTANREEQRISPRRVTLSCSPSPRMKRRGKKLAAISKPYSETKYEKTIKTPPSNHRAILLSRNASYTMRKAKPRKESPSPPWVETKKQTRALDTIPYIVKKSPRIRRSLEKIKKTTRRKKVGVSPTKRKNKLSCHRSPKRIRVKSHRVRPTPTPTPKTPVFKMKMKSESVKRKATRDSKRCKTCKKIRPYQENQTPDYASIYDSRVQGNPNSLFCFKPDGKFNGIPTKSRIIDLIRGSSAVSAVLRGNKPIDEKKSRAEDTNTNKTLLRQDGERAGLNAYNTNASQLTTGNKLLLSTTSANRSVHNILLQSQQAYMDQQQKRMHINQTGNRDGGDGNSQSFTDDFVRDDQRSINTNSRNCHISRYEKYHRNATAFASSKPYSQNGTLIDNDDRQTTLRPELANFGEEARKKNILHIERQRLVRDDSLFPTYAHMATSHLEQSRNLLPRRLQRTYAGQHAKMNTDSLNKKDKYVHLSGDQNNERMNKMNKASRNINGYKMDYNPSQDLELSRHWFDAQRPQLIDKSFVKIKSNKWRCRHKPYTKTVNSKDSHGAKLSDLSEVTSTLGIDASKQTKSWLTHNQETATGYQEWNDRSDILPTTPLTPINDSSQSMNPDSSINPTTSSVNSPLNKNNCSPSRLDKTNVKNIIANNDAKAEGKAITISSEMGFLDANSPSLNTVETIKVNSERDTLSRAMEKEREIDSVKKLTNQRISGSSLSRKPSPLRFVQRKIRSISALKKPTKPFQSFRPPITSGSSRDSIKWTDGQNQAESFDDSLKCDDNVDLNVLLYENTVSLGVQTSVTSLRNTAVQTSPIGPTTLLPDAHENTNFINEEICNNDYQLVDPTSSKQTHISNQQNTLAATTEKLIDIKDKTIEIPTQITIAPEDSHCVNDEGTCTKVVGGNASLNPRHTTPRRWSLQPRSSSCSRTSERISSIGSSPVSVLQDGHAWMGRPRWEDANIDEVNRRVERALKLRQELQKHKKGRLRNVRDSTLSRDDDTKSPPCIVKEQANIGDKNMHKLGGRDKSVEDIRLETSGDFEKGGTIYPSKSQTRISGLSNTPISNIRTMEDCVKVSKVLDYPNATKNKFLSEDQNRGNESETTGTIGKTFPFNADNAESDLLHPLSSAFGSTPWDKKSWEFKVDKTTYENRSPPDSSLGANRTRSPEQCQSYHGNIAQHDLISTVRIRPASTAPFSGFPESVLNNLRGANKNWVTGTESNKNSPPIKISKMENVIQSEYPRLVGELVQALPHVPLASFVEWFIETSNPGQFTNSDNSISPEIKEMNNESKNNSLLSDRTDTDDNPVTITKLTCRQYEPPTSEMNSDSTHIQTPVEFTIGDSSDSPQSNYIIYNNDSITSNEEQTTPIDDGIENQLLKTSIRRIWLTKNTQIQHGSSGDVMFDNDKRKIIPQKK